MNSDLSYVNLKNPLCLGGCIDYWWHLLIATQAGQCLGSECFHFGLLLKQKASSTKDIHEIRI